MELLTNALKALGFKLNNICIVRLTFYYLLRNFVIRSESFLLLFKKWKIENRYLSAQLNGIYFHILCFPSSWILRNSY